MVETPYPQARIGEIMNNFVKRVAARYLKTATKDFFDEFGFDIDDEEPELDPEIQTLRDFEKKVGGMAQLIAPKRVLRDVRAAAIIGNKIHYIAPHKAWFVYADIPQRGALKLGKRLYRGLIGRRNLPSSNPALHQVPLWIGTSDGSLTPVGPKNQMRAADFKEMVRRVAGCGCDGGSSEDSEDVEINIYGEDLEAARKFDPLDKANNPNYGPPYKNEAGKWEPENKGKCYYQTRNEADRCYVTNKGGPSGKSKGKNKQKAGPPKSEQRKKYNKEYKKMRWPKGNR